MDKVVKNKSIREALVEIREIVGVRRDTEANHLGLLKSVGEGVDISSLYESLEYAQKVKLNTSAIEDLINHAVQEHNNKVKLNKDVDKLNEAFDTVNTLINDLEGFIDLDLPLDLSLKIDEDGSEATIEPTIKPDSTLKILNPELLPKVYHNPPQKRYPIKLKTPEGDEFVILGYMAVDEFLGLGLNSTHTRVKQCKTKYSDGSIPYMGYTLKVLSIEEFERLTGVYND